MFKYSRNPWNGTRGLPLSPELFTINGLCDCTAPMKQFVSASAFIWQTALLYKSAYWHAEKWLLSCTPWFTLCLTWNVSMSLCRLGVNLKMSIGKKYPNFRLMNAWSNQMYSLWFIHQARHRDLRTIKKQNNFTCLKQRSRNLICASFLQELDLQKLLYLKTRHCVARGRETIVSWAATWHNLILKSH